MIQRLYNEAVVPGIAEIDHRVDVTYMADVGLIKDNANPISLHRVKLYTSSGEAYFQRTYILVDHVDRPTPISDIDTGSQ